MTTEATRRAARRFYDAINELIRTGDPAALDASLAPNAIDHDPTPEMQPGRDGILRAFAAVRDRFPDYRGTVEDIVVEGDKAACRITGRMTHEGREVVTHGIDILRFEADRLVDRWGVFERPPSP